MPLRFAIAAVLILFPCGFLAADSGGREDRRTDWAEDDKKLREAADEADRELRKAADERDRELDKAYEEAVREGKPEKWREKRREILSKYDESASKARSKLAEEYGKLGVAPAGPLDGRRPRGQASGRTRVDADGAESLPRRDPPTPRSLRRELAEIDGAIASERRTHELRTDDLKLARRRADARAVRRIDALIDREDQRHRKRLRQLESRSADLLSRAGPRERRTDQNPTDGGRGDDDDGPSLDELEREIDDDERRGGR